MRLLCYFEFVAITSKEGDAVMRIESHRNPLSDMGHDDPPIIITRRGMEGVVISASSDLDEAARQALEAYHAYERGYDALPPED